MEVSSDVVLAAGEDSVTVTATVSDDGEPSPAKLHSWWRQVAGPEPVVFTPGIHDPAREFANPPPPGSPWSFGWTEDLSSPLSAFDTFGEFKPGVDVHGAAGSPYLGIYFNRTESDVRDGTGLFEVDEINLHPSSAGRYAVVRWTAPVTGEFMLEGYFAGRQKTTTTDAQVIHNGRTELWSDLILSLNAVSPFRLVVAVRAGETLDFQVGCGTNADWANDGTGLSVQIHPVESPLTAAFPAVGRYVLRLQRVRFGTRRLGRGRHHCPQSAEPATRGHRRSRHRSRG